MTTTNTPFKDAATLILSHYKEYLTGVYQGSQDYDESVAIHSLTQLHKAAIVAELEALLKRSDMAWVKRGTLDSHETFVHSNIIADRIEQYKKEGK